MSLEFVSANAIAGLMSESHLLVLQEHNRVGVANGGLQQTLGILRAPGRDNLQSRDAAIPGGVILGVLRGDTSGETVGATESDVARLNTSRHVMRLSGGVDDLIDRLHGKVESHELALPSYHRPVSLNVTPCYTSTK